jgi:hypothetical protein
MTTQVNVLSTAPTPLMVRELHEKHEPMWANPPRMKKQRHKVRKQIEICWHSLESRHAFEVEQCWHEHVVQGRALEAAAACEPLFERSRLIEIGDEPIRPRCPKTRQTLGERFERVMSSLRLRRAFKRELKTKGAPKPKRSEAIAKHEQQIRLTKFKLARALV